MASRTGQVLLVDGKGGLASIAAAAAQATCCVMTVAADFEPVRKLLAQQKFDLILDDTSALDADALDRFLDLDLSNQGKVMLLGADAAARHARGTTATEVEHGLESISFEAMQQLMRSALQAAPAEKIHTAHEFNGMVGHAACMRALFANIRRVAPLDVGVLVQGESGTGKELVARALHTLSGRDGKFVAVNCGAISPELLSSQIFGHERGAFTGAMQSHAGFFEQAAGGTVFLDEITEMPLPLQVYLLRVIELHSLTRVGGSREIPVSARVVAASNRDLQRAVAAGELRQDLYFRLLDFPLTVPPLRERKEDIPLLAQHFLARLNSRYRSHTRISDHVTLQLRARAWPGNVRELQHEVQRLYILAGDDGEIDVPIEPERVLWRRASDRGRPGGHHEAREHGHRHVPASHADSVCFEFGMTLEDVERAVVLNTLTHCHNSKREAARVLGVSLKTIYNKLLRYRSQGVIDNGMLDDASQNDRRAS